VTNGDGEQMLVSSTVYPEDILDLPPLTVLANIQAVTAPAQTIGFLAYLTASIALLPLADPQVSGEPYVDPTTHFIAVSQGSNPYTNELNFSDNRNSQYLPSVML
jgi:hypothetical protein